MVDVIIPAYNCAKTLGRTLASLAAQTDSDFSVTVVDDCSSESLEGIVETYRELLKDLRYIRRAENGGAGIARQTGIDETDGEWITFVDADDILMPYAIEVFKIIIENNPDMNVLHSTFLQQQIEDGKHGYISLTRGFTWLHGKLYRRDFLNRYEISFSEEFPNWADDSYFNSQCSELSAITMNELPMYVWTDTANSLTRKDADSGRRNVDVLMRAMIKSAEKVLRYKDSIGHIGNTISNIDALMAKSETPMNDKERESYVRLCEIYEQYGVKTPKPKRKLFARK